MTNQRQALAIRLGSTRRGQRILHLLLTDAANLTAPTIAARAHARYTTFRLLDLLQTEGLIVAETRHDLPVYRLTDAGRRWVRWLLNLQPQPDRAADLLAHCDEQEQRGLSRVQIRTVRGLLGGGQ